MDVPANAKFTDTTYSAFKGATSGAAGTAGLVPAPAAGDQNKVLGADGTWKNQTSYTHPAYTPRTSGLYKITVDATGHVSAVTAVAKSDITALGIPGQDTNTTYSNMKGATSSAAGAAGLVPAPAAGKQASFLRGDGTRAVPTDTKYSVATQSANGLMSAADKKSWTEWRDDHNRVGYHVYTDLWIRRMTYELCRAEHTETLCTEILW